MQLSLFSTSTNNKTKPNNNHKKHKVSSTTAKWQQIQEWNTIEGIELIKPLNELYAQLFIMTFSQKLDCLNYFVDEEKDESNSYTMMYAEIKDTWQLPLPERYNQHKELLERIINHDNTLVYCQNKEVLSDKLSLFNCVYN